MARYSAAKGQQMVKIKDDCTMTRTAFKDSPAYTLLNLNKTIYLTHAGQKQWAVLSVDRYEKMLKELEDALRGRD